MKFKFNASATSYLGIFLVVYAVVQAVVGFNAIPTEMDRNFWEQETYAEEQRLWDSFRLLYIAVPSLALAISGAFMFFGRRIMSLATLIVGYLGVGAGLVLLNAGRSYWSTPEALKWAPDGLIAYRWGKGELIHYWGAYIWSWNGESSLRPQPFLVSLVVAFFTITILWVAQAVSRSVKSGFALAKQAENEGTFAPNSGTSIAAMVLAIVIPWLGIVLAYVARNEIKRSQGKVGGARLVQMALLLGWCMVALQVIAGVIYALVILSNLPK